ncbi:MAG: VanZ family protein [candidate division KSB1 bacterium]|nr:VanZ family protein [candidate division KSB1 bacterium]
MKQLFSRWTLPAWLWGMFILVMTSYPKVKIPQAGFMPMDKILHAGVYFVFAVLVSRALTRYRKEELKQHMIVSTLITVGFALFDEIHQIFIPGRFGDIADAAADIVGIIAAQIVFVKIIQPLVKPE